MKETNSRFGPRVAQLTQGFPPAIGGVGTHVHDLSQQLSQLGVAVTVYTSLLQSHNTGGTLWDHDHIRVRRFTPYTLLDLKHGLGTVIPGMAVALLSDDVDLVHAHGYGYYTTFLGVLARRALRRPLIITPHADRGRPSVEKRMFDALVPRLTLQEADHVIAVTASEAGYLASLGVDPNRISVVPNGIDLRRFDGLPAPRFFRDKWGVEGKLVLFVGRVYNEQKGLEYLVKASPLVFKHVSATIALVGQDYGSTAYLRDLGRRLGVEQRIRFCGAVEEAELLSAYAAADVVVLPSVFEPFGIVLLEAMAAGKPAVASRVGGIPDVVRHGETGWLVPPASPEALAAAVTDLLLDDDLALRFGERGRVVAQAYSWDRVARQILGIYLRVLS